MICLKVEILFTRSVFENPIITEFSLLSVEQVTFLSVFTGNLPKATLLLS